MLDAVIMHDGNFVQYINPAGIALFRYASLFEMQCLSIFQLVDDIFVYRAIIRAEKLRVHPETQLPDAQYLFVRKDGTKFYGIAHSHDWRWAEVYIGGKIVPIYSRILYVREA
jgi:hypothetical protein